MYFLCMSKMTRLFVYATFGMSREKDYVYYRKKYNCYFGERNKLFIWLENVHT